MRKTIFLMALWIGIPWEAKASQLVAKDAMQLERASKYVIIGKVTASTFDNAKLSGEMEIAVVGVLKGKVMDKSVHISVDKNPLSGFDVLLKQGDVAVFFIREIKDRRAVLSFSGASAIFPKDYFN